MRISLACLALWLCAALAHADSPVLSESQKILASDGSFPDQFGHSISIDGNTALVAAYADGNGPGAVYSYEKDQSGVWQQNQKFSTSGLTRDALFGQDVAQFNDYAVVSAYQQNFPAGAAYLFKKGVAGQWAQVTQLLPGETTNRFGWSVSMASDLAAVGAPLTGAGAAPSGVVYLFSPNASNQWVRTDRIVPGDANNSARFGLDVSLYENRLLVGAPFDDDQGFVSGSAYLYEKQGTAWTQLAKLTASDGAPLSEFGNAVSLGQDVALIGAGQQGSQAAYLFHQTAPGQWEELAKLVPDDPAPGNGFGGSVSLWNNLALVGAEGTGVGAAYLFQFDRQGNWSQLAKFIASDGQVEDFFGRAVAMADGSIIIGAEGDDDRGDIAGSAYAFDVPEPATTWLAGLAVCAVYTAPRHRRGNRHTLA